MKTTTLSLTSLFLTLVCSFVVCQQAHAGITDTPAEGETPPPVVEPPSTPEPEKKPTTSDEKSSKKDADAKAEKAAKKKKAKEEKTDAAASTETKTEDASGKTSEMKKDDSKPKKAKKKTEKSDDKTADGTDADAKKTDKSADKKADGKKSDDKDDTDTATIGDGAKRPKSTVPLPTRLASFTCGAVLGFPFAMAKRTAHQTEAGKRDFIGDSTNPIAVTLATIVSLPFGFVGGVFEGVEYTVINSWNGSGQQPFGKESFSRGDDD